MNKEKTEAMKQQQTHRTQEWTTVTKRERTGEDGREGREKRKKGGITISSHNVGGGTGRAVKHREDK